MAIAAVSQSDRERRMPGEEGVWLFILGDIMVFSLFFVVFLYYRGLNVELFAQSQTHLNQAFGALNTFFMLTSSWCVALAVHAARRNLGRVTPLMIILALLCGLGFAVVKCLEYAEKIRAGITLTTNDFYMYYFMFTGIHFVHVLIGMGVLAFFARYTWSGNYAEGRVRHLESGASFWHLVDLLWIVLFALIYLLK